MSSEEERNSQINEWRTTNAQQYDRERGRRPPSPCPSVAIERVVVNNPLTKPGNINPRNISAGQQREEEKREREEARERHIENEKLRLRNRVEDIFPGARLITGVLSDARWCTPCPTFNISQCDIPERMQAHGLDKQIRHICAICHFAAGICNSHTARNCKLERFLTHETEKRREERRHQLSTRTEAARERLQDQGQRSHWYGQMAPPHPAPNIQRHTRGRAHPYARPDYDRR